MRVDIDQSGRGKVTQRFADGSDACPDPLRNVGKDYPAAGIDLPS